MLLSATLSTITALALLLAIAAFCACVAAGRADRGRGL